MFIKSARRALRRRIQPLLVSSHDLLYPSLSGRFTSIWDSAPERRIDANSWIAQKLTAGEPFCVARFGADELEVTQDWRRRTNRSTLGRAMEILASGDPIYASTRARARLKQRGLHPLTPDTQKRFHDVMVEAMPGIDLLGSWIAGETWFRDYLDEVSVASIDELEPYFSDSPWSAKLAGKKVLVVHPFASTITRQYKENRENIFGNKAVLPRFDLDTLVPPRAHFGEIENAQHWFESLNELIEKALGRQFDVAIIGAGPFGLPLATAIKKAERQAIHLGGATQLLFGIRGSRWERRPAYQSIMNESWCRPSADETPPEEARRMSGGSYW